jgi:hypothetical protein
MVLRFTLSIALLILGLPGDTALKAETPAQACKSTVTGTLEMGLLESTSMQNAPQIPIPTRKKIMAAARTETRTL